MCFYLEEHAYLLLAEKALNYLGTRSSFKLIKGGEYSGIFTGMGCTVQIV